MTTPDTASPGLPAAVHPALASALAARGYDTLTPVQLSVLDAAAANADLLVSAQTGSGKTVAFGMSIAPTLLGEAAQFEAADRPLGLVIAPTRELALQVRRELEWLYAGAGISIASCVGGMDARTERRALERGAHLVVGTPGRLRDHITRGALDLGAIRAVVLDEADEMLDLGFREDLEFILAAAPAERRTLMFSATVPRSIAELAKTFQRDAVRLTATAASQRHGDIEYQLVLTQGHERENAIINTLLLLNDSNTLVFCHTREAVKHLTARLANRGFPVVALSGELSQSERSNALQAMRDGRARVCVATDVAARGIDLPSLDLVIHADLPSKPETLLHRSGRTGRAGRKGLCMLIVPTHRRAAAQRLLKLANVAATTRAAPTQSEIEARTRQQILDGVATVVPPDEAEQAFVAELLARVSPEQLAAAYLRQQLAARPAPEEVSDTPITPYAEKPARRDRPAWDSSAEPTAPRGDMTGGVWFTLSLGRRHRADPKWLLPMICKAGGVTKRDVGSIKIDDTATRFEIAADKAEAFAALVAKGVSGEKGVTIVPATAAPEARRMPRSEKPRTFAPVPARETKPHYKVRSDRGRDLGTQPAEAGARAEEVKPGKAHGKLVNPKDKGKPKYKPKFAGEDKGAATRKRPKPVKA